MSGEVTEWWNFQSMMASNTIGYIRYVVKRHVLKHSLFEAYSFRTHTFPHHLSAKVWTWIAKMVVWCSEPKGAQRSACSQHQKQDKNMNFTAGVCCTLCWSTQNRCHICLPSVQDNVTLRTNCKCLTPECIVITPGCNEMALYIINFYRLWLVPYYTIQRTSCSFMFQLCESKMLWRQGNWVVWSLCWEDKHGQDQNRCLRPSFATVQPCFSPMSNKVISASHRNYPSYIQMAGRRHQHTALRALQAKEKEKTAHHGPKAWGLMHRRSAGCSEFWPSQSSQKP